MFAGLKAALTNIASNAIRDITGTDLDGNKRGLDVAVGTGQLQLQGTPTQSSTDLYKVNTSPAGLNKEALDVAIHTGSGLGDAFGRLRMSQLFTIFDSKQINDNQPLFWDDQEVSGSGTSSTYNTGKASVSMNVSANTAGKRVRQTFQRFNYQPGKSQLIVLTANLNGSSSGITAGVGYFDDDNGVFFQAKDGAVYVATRSSTTGSVVDTKVAQADWNIDKMDGTGQSGVTLDPSKVQILFIDFEWLGVGRVRFGFFVDGVPIYCHEALHTNVDTTVYMSTPNLPVRYEIENDGTGVAAELLHICASVASEGGRQDNGILRHADSGTVASMTSGNSYAMLGIRLKSTHLDVVTLIENLSILATTKDDTAHWELYFNPTVAGTFTYSDVTNSGLQVAIGSNTNTITGGTEIDGGYFSTALPITNAVPNALKLGSAIDGTPDELVIACRPITSSMGAEASITWRELS